MKINEIILNELKEYIDPNSYGAWININGTINSVNDHTLWLKKKYGDPYAYDKAFNEGWVRIINYYDNDINLEGKLDNIRKTFKLWWPTAIQKDRVIIEKRQNNATLRTTKIYLIPKDKNKLLKDFSPSSKAPLLTLENKIIINELKEYIDPNSYGAWVNVDGQIDNIPTKFAHYKWLEDKYGDKTAYKKAYLNNWVRIAIPDSDSIMYITGSISNIKKTFKWWWPSAILTNMVIIENENKTKSFSYIFPEEKNKLLRDFKN